MSTAAASSRSSFGALVLLGMAAGLALGAVVRVWPGHAGPLATVLELTGASFVTLLKAVVPPLVVTAVIASVGRAGSLADGPRLVLKTLVGFAGTAALAVAVGLALGTMLEPGRHAGIAAAAAATPSTVGGWTDFLKSLVPANVLGLQASSSAGPGGAVKTALGFNVLQLMVISLALGVAALRAGARGAALLEAAETGYALVRTILGWVIRLTPIGTAGLLGTAVATYGWSSVGSLGAFVLAVYLGLAVVLLLIYPVLLAVHGLSVRRFFATAWPAIQLGFVSRSSLGTLPVSEERALALGVPRDYAAFAVPLGATTKMDGCAAIYPAVASLFVAQFYGVPLGASAYLLIALVAVLGSTATAGATGATVMLTLTLSTLGLPLEGAGLLLAIDPVLDMGRTAVNVAGQILVPYLVAAREGMLEEADPPVAGSIGGLTPA
ncbi:MAG: dicarboxylate/amino acid:cation symporter [Alphaproteobacteria bacterium]|nr:dicarboxylate/amino acid:cation symporter [Alphaproteobacteria bacterium]